MSGQWIWILTAANLIIFVFGAFFINHMISEFSRHADEILSNNKQLVNEMHKFLDAESE